MGKRTDGSLRVWLIFGSLLLLLLALFTSRLLLSVATIAFLAFTCIHTNIGKQLICFAKTPLLIGISLLFFIPLISGLWSSDQVQWLRSVRIKLPLLLMPIAFAGRWQLATFQWRIVCYFFLILLFVCCSWSMGEYLLHREAINQGYLRAKSLPTPLGNDHIRFSLCVVAGIITSIYLLVGEKRRLGKILLSVCAIYFAVYLHVLSARTGLVGLYLFCVVAIVYFVVQKGKRRSLVWIPVIALALPLLAWFTMPTFSNRVKYMLYDFQHVADRRYLPGSNDGSRIVSMQAGWSILRRNPSGVGAGDVIGETMKWYAEHEPMMLSTGLYPSSEWLMYGDAAGWIGMIVFTAVMFLPFFLRRRGRMFSVAVNLAMMISLAFDIGLEVQFGVFIYAFLLLWWWKMTEPDPILSQ